MLSSFLLIPPELTPIIESQEGFQDFKSAVKARALVLHTAELDPVKAKVLPRAMQELEPALGKRLTMKGRRFGTFSSAVLRHSVCS